MSEQFIDNLDRDSDNSSSNTKPTSDDEMSWAHPLDSWSGDSNICIFIWRKVCQIVIFYTVYISQLKQHRYALNTLVYL
jgi:hypothetical protein